MKRAIALGLLAFLLCSCEGDPNDPQTWIKKLDEGALREKSVDELTRIYTDTLNAAQGNNDDAKVKAARDAIVPALVEAYKKYRDDVGNRDKILSALATMHDGRAEEVFITALDFTPDLSEAQAVKGAEGLGALRSQRGIDPLLACLAKITANRPVDNQMKRAIVEAFGKIKDPRSVPALIHLVDTSPDEQDFFINKLATIALGDIGDPRGVPALIRALFLSGRGAVIFPQARYALVQIGPTAVEPLIQAMKGQDAELNRLATTLQFEPGVMAWKTARVLGDIGDARAFDPLLEQLNTPNMSAPGAPAAPPGAPPPDASVVQGFAALALSQVAHTPEQQTRAADAIVPKLRDEQAFGAWVSYLAALSNLGGPARAGAIKDVFSREMLPNPGIRVAGAMWWSRMSTSDETAAFDRVVHEEDDPGLIEGLNVHRARFVVAGACHEDVTCWLGKLDDADPIVADKAGYMLGYLGAGNEAVKAALIAHLNARNTDVRSAVLFAIDRLSPQGCRPCVERMRAIAAEEEGRQSYNQVNIEALCTAARMSHREGH